MEKYLRVAMAACLAVSWSSQAPALDEVSVGELSYLDRQ